MKINLTDVNGVTLKTAGTYVEEDLEVGLSESDKSSLVPENVAEGITILGVEGTFKGGGVEIPSVSNIELNMDTLLLSWTAPDITELAEYSPTISYIIQIRDHELTTTSTSISLSGYLQEGSNEILVKVKAVLTHYDNGITTTTDYSQPEYYIAILDATTSVFRKFLRGVKVGNEVYIFGGYDENNYAYKSVDIFNLETETMSTIDDIGDSYNYECGLVAVGTDIYKIEGRAKATSSGLKVIKKLDTITKSWTTLGVTIPQFANNTLIALYLEGYIYIFMSSYAYKYNIENDSIDIISKINDYMSMNPTNVVNGNIYSLYNKALYIYDSDSDTWSVLGESRTYHTQGVMLNKDNYIYIIGDQNVKNIDKYNMENNTSTLISEQLPKLMNGGFGVEHNGIFYVWDGSEYYGGNTLVKLVLE